MDDLFEPLPIGQVGFKNLPSKKIYLQVLYNQTRHFSNPACTLYPLLKKKEIFATLFGGGRGGPLEISELLQIKMDLMLQLHI